MLAGLSIRDVVLIDRLDLDFGPGLSVLTGETGAGKSILLDALGLALGARADASLVRSRAEQAVVTATFELPDGHAALALLEAHGIERDETLVLRRTLSPDGRSRAYVNDQPSSVTFLRTLGESLVEIQGQGESRGLLDPLTHREALDQYAGATAEVAALGALFGIWREAESALTAARESQAQAHLQEEELRHRMGELDALDPQPGEEAKLDERRAILKNRERLLEALQSAHAALGGARPVQDAIRTAERELMRVAAKAGGGLDAALEALARAGEATLDAEARLEAFAISIEHDSHALERLEDRLYALRDLARKHRVKVEDLPALRSETAAALARIGDRGGAFARLEHAFGLFHLRDQRVEAHGGVTSTPRPFLIGACSLAAATRSAAAAVDSAESASGMKSASSPRPSRANCRRVACIRVCSK